VPPDPDTSEDKPAPTPRQLAGLLWRVVWQVLRRLLLIGGFVLAATAVAFIAGHCGK
jgi:hypothetical protein